MKEIYQQKKKIHCCLINSLKQYGSNFTVSYILHIGTSAVYSPFNRWQLIYAT